MKEFRIKLVFLRAVERHGGTDASIELAATEAFGDDPEAAPGSIKTARRVCDDLLSWNGQTVSITPKGYRFLEDHAQMP